MYLAGIVRGGTGTRAIRCGCSQFGTGGCAPVMDHTASMTSARHQHAINMTASRHQHDCIKASAWYPHDCIKASACHQHDSTKASACHQHDCTKASACHQHGIRMVLLWHHYGRLFIKKNFLQRFVCVGLICAHCGDCCFYTIYRILLHLGRHDALERHGWCVGQLFGSKGA